MPWRQSRGETLVTRCTIQKPSDVFFEVQVPLIICMELQVDRCTITDRDELVHAWEDHFSSVSIGRITDTYDIQVAQREIVSLTSASHSHKDYVFDVEFEAETSQRPFHHYVIARLLDQIESPVSALSLVVTS